MVAHPLQRIGGDILDRLSAAERSYTNHLDPATTRVLGLLPDAIEAPTLLVRASEPLMEWTREYDWRPSWKLEHTTVDVPGTHFTVMEEHSHTTARAVEEWLDRL